MDIATLARDQGMNCSTERGKYARVSIEIDLQKKLTSRLIVRD